jgi:hypothetical protein
MATENETPGRDLWDLESWAYLKDNRALAVKITVRLSTKPGPTELAYYRAQATGLFRRTYKVWANGLGEQVKEVAA